MLWLFAVGTFASGAHGASLPPTASSQGMVVAAQHLATEAGVQMLRRGGNAIDAAVAVAFAEAVVNPCCGNIGGGGFMTAHLADGRDIFLDFRETAPGAATRDMYLDGHGGVVHGASLFGWKAVAVPGAVLGLDTALAKYGTLARQTVMAPAIALARDGFVLEAADADTLARGAKLLGKDPTAARIFLHPDGTPLRAGERLRQADLAATLQAIADGGPDAFYKGRIPQAIEAAARAGGGIVTAADLAAYRVDERAPLSCPYRDYQVLSAPPPSSGGTTICETLDILEGYDLRGMGFHAAKSVHVLTEALRLAFFDRNKYMGDPAFVQMPMNRLLSKDYATDLRGRITDRAVASASLGPAVPRPGEKTETTHFSIVDGRGGAVGVTTTLNGAFGAGTIAGDSGFLLNDEMDDFTLKADAPNQYGLVQGSANAIAPGKRPLSSMAPTIVMKGSAVMMVVGSPGGPRIITATLETILNVLDYGMDAQQAVDAPRLHHQWLPDVLLTERFALSPDTQAMLEQMGYRMQEEKPWGAVEVITSGALPGPHPADARMFYGADDPRRPAGAAMAP